MANLIIQSSHEKNYSKVTFNYKQQTYTFHINIASDGMVENALGVILCLLELGYNSNNLLENIPSFQSLPKVMEQKEIITKDKRKITILDDSHNAAIPSMINAIDAFNHRSVFYKGKKILVLGQVADLGDQSEELHDKIYDYVIQSKADIVFGHGQNMKKVIRKLPRHKTGGWFVDARTLARLIPYYCTDDSFILLKGSVSGGDFQKTSHLLPIMLQSSEKVFHSYTESEITEVLQPVPGLVVYQNDNNKKIASYGNRASISTEGLGAILFHYLLLTKKPNKAETVKLNKWPTNEGTSLQNKAFKKGTVFTQGELIKEVIYTQHPSAIFELAFRVFNSRKNAYEQIKKIVAKHQLPIEAVLNLTGRFRIKEQQRYGLNELLIVAKLLEPYKEDLRNIMEIENGKIHGVIFGHTRKSIIAFIGNNIICGCGFKNEKLLRETVQSIFVT